jgi:hypothetical protein
MKISESTAARKFPIPLLWSQVDILREFYHEVRTDDTLRKKLKACEETPDENGLYTTQQVVGALYGDSSRERIRETKERADNWRLKNDILRGELLPKSLLVPALENIFIIIVQLIQASSLSALEKKDLLANIASWPVVVQNVAAKAKVSETPAGENGENGHEEA